MGNISRRDFLAAAAMLGAEAAWGRAFSTPSKISWRERRDLFPEGVGGWPTSPANRNSRNEDLILNLGAPSLRLRSGQAFRGFQKVGPCSKNKSFFVVVKVAIVAECPHL